jgi:hypothetical protein
MLVTVVGFVVAIKLVDRDTTTTPLLPVTDMVVTTGTSVPTGTVVTTGTAVTVGVAQPGSAIVASRAATPMNAITIVDFFIVLVGFETGTLFTHSNGLSTGLFNGELPDQIPASQEVRAISTTPNYPETTPTLAICLERAEHDSNDHNYPE